MTTTAQATRTDAAFTMAVGGGDVDLAAAQLAEQAEARSDELDALCRLPDDLYAGAARLGLFRQLVPVELGGRGDTPAVWFRRGMALAQRDASFAWVVTQGAAELGWIAAGGDPAWAAEVLADPLAASASTTAGIGSLTTGADGRTGILSGTWSFDTGCHGATWIGGLAFVDGAGPRMCWVPASRATIVEDWDAIGLRGTGSHGVAIAEQEVDTAWTIDLFAPTTNDRGAHRSLVGNGNWPIASAVAAVQLGNARRALDEARRLVAEKAPAPVFAPLARSASVQRRVGELEGAWMAATASVERELASMWLEACAFHAVPAEQRWRLATANAAAARIAVEVVDGAAELAGSSVASRHARVSRCLRDAHALRGHVATCGAVLERAAQVALGLTAPDLFV